MHTVQLLLRRRQHIASTKSDLRQGQDPARSELEALLLPCSDLAQDLLRDTVALAGELLCSSSNGLHKVS